MDQWHTLPLVYCCFKLYVVPVSNQVKQIFQMWRLCIMLKSIIVNSEAFLKVCLNYSCIYGVYIYFRLAEEELLWEARRGASRAAVGGALAWQKCPLPPTNKRFLSNVIQYTLNANKLKEERKIKKSKLINHCSEYSVQKKNYPHISESNRKRTRNDTCSVQNHGEKRETSKRRVDSKHKSRYVGQSSSV